MRPKKVLLLVDQDENALSILKFVLETNGYRVLAATGGKEAIAMFAATPVVDMVLAAAFMNPMNGERLVARLKQMQAYVPMAIMRETGDKPSDDFVADRWISRSTAPAVLLDLAKVMCARKRGPRKGAWREITAWISLVST